MRGMRVLRGSGSASDVYTWQNNYLNNFQPQVGEGCEVRVYIGER